MLIEDETIRFRPTAEILDREHVRIRLPLPDNQPAARLQHPAQLTQRLVPIRDLAQGGDRNAASNVAAGNGRSRASPGWQPRRRACQSCPAHQLVEHRLLQIEHIEPTIWRKLTRDVEAVVTGVGSDFEHPLAWSKIEHVA